MNIVYLLLPASLLIGAGFVVAFAWAARRGQFDDLSTPGFRVLFGDEEPVRRRAPAASEPGSGG
ncbi:MAG: cbb3-type cytochrome oxidase assembly protein CcoS [Planctomycetota bacterium]|nr:cbb3-type cytochrome oxidase assembly protein CcoS [Planctomycetota bacterium]